MIGVLNVMEVQSLLTALSAIHPNTGKPHKSEPLSFVRTLSCSVFGSSALRGFYEFDLIHIDFFFSLTQIYSPSQPPVVRVTKGPLFSEVTTTFPHITQNLRLYNIHGKRGQQTLNTCIACSHHYLQYVNQIFTLGICKMTFSSSTEVLYNQAAFEFL